MRRVHASRPRACLARVPRAREDGTTYWKQNRYTMLYLINIRWNMAKLSNISLIVFKSRFSIE